MGEQPELIMRMADVVAVIVVVGSGISAGGLLMFAAGILPSMRRLAADAYAVSHQSLDQDIERYMPWVGRATMVAGIALAALQSGLVPRLFAVAGIIGMIALVVISETVNVPINKMIVREWRPGELPGDVDAIRARWARFHVMRTVAALAALILFAISAVTGD